MKTSKTDSQPQTATPAAPTTALGSYGLAIARALEASGVDSARIFRAADVPMDLSNDPLNRLETATLTRLYRTCVDVTHNPYFGLTVARFMQISNFHALGYALAASATLMDFCRRLERYFRLVSQVATVQVVDTGDEVQVRFHRNVPHSGETEDAFLSFLILTMRMLYKPGFNPVRVELHRPMPREGAAPYEEMMCSPVSFSNEEAVLAFNKAELLRPLDNASTELAQLNDNIVVGYLARLDKSDVVNAVKQKIIEYLPDGECSRDRVASALCMSPTTLQLKLSQRGANFLQLLDDTRKELACSYVQQSGRSVTEITFLLGFSDTSNFTRAFKRWTGVSPTDYRQQT